MAARKAAGKLVPSPVEYVQLTIDGQTAWYARNTKWGCSIGWFQIRALREPQLWGSVDKLRVAADLRDPVKNAKAAFAISKGGTDFSLWSTYTDKAYEKFLDVDYELKTGHARADDWDI